MPLIVNLNTLVSYSFEKTIRAFVSLCNQHTHGRLQKMPFFRTVYNNTWVHAQYLLNKSLIDQYKLGKIDTPTFLDGLSDIFPFAAQHQLLADTWNTSIQISDENQSKFASLLALGEPVYLISNTNELNVRAILKMFAQKNPSVNETADISVQPDTRPIEIAPNIYLCLSYRFGILKNSTPGLLQQLQQTLTGPLSLVSEFPADRATAEQLGFAAVHTSLECIDKPAVCLST